MRLRGAMVARLTPDQKAACSNHVGVNVFFFFFHFYSTIFDEQVTLGDLPQICLIFHQRNSLCLLLFFDEAKEKQAKKISPVTRNSVLEIQLG